MQERTSQNLEWRASGPVSALLEVKDLESSESSCSIQTTEKDVNVEIINEHASTLTTILLVTIWIFLSSLVILFNKYIFENTGFHYPLTLTCWHFVFATLTTQILSRTTQMLDGRLDIEMTGRLYIRSIVPIGVMYSGSLMGNNLSYLTLSVAFVQMMKGLDPAITLFAMWALRIASTTPTMWFNVLVIVVGVGMTAVGEVRFVLSGFLFQVGGRLCQSFRLAMIQRLLSSEKYDMDPMVSLYYFAPICGIMIGAVASIVELPSVEMDDIVNTGPWLLLANAAVAFLLNAASVLMIGKTSALMLSLTGVLQTIFLIVASALIWGTVVTRLQTVGCVCATVGLLYHSLGAEKLHSFIGTRFRTWRSPCPAQFASLSFSRPHIAVFVVTAAAVAGAAAGWSVGYSLGWNPREYWYSGSRLFGESG